MSTDERVATGNGLDAQAATVTAAIAARGWELVATFTDEARSGGNLRRPALLDALPCRARGLAPRAEVAEAIAAERAAALDDRRRSTVPSRGGTATSNGWDTDHDNPANAVVG